MVRFFSQQRIQKRFAGWLLAAAMGLNGNENSIDFGEMLGVVETKNPAAVGLAVHVEDAEVGGVGFFS